MLNYDQDGKVLFDIIRYYFGISYLHFSIVDLVNMDRKTIKGD